MERKIGEIFEYNGEWYQCVESKQDVCTDCAFNPINSIRYNCSGSCAYKKVIFKKLEKVGEPYTHYCPSGRIIYFQRYKLFYNLYSHNTEYIMCDFNEDGIVSIELKQNKEDMEENKTPLPKEDNHLTRTVYNYVNGKISDKELIRSIKEMPDEYPYNKNNLKPFDLEAAKAGKPVCTRDGRKARIICFDFRDADEICCIIAAVDYGEAEKIHYYDLYGKYRGGDSSKYDLMMLPEKKSGWINIYTNNTIENSRYCGSNIYASKEEALNNISPSLGNYVNTGKIEWEE